MEAQDLYRQGPQLKQHLEAILMATHVNDNGFEQPTLRRRPPSQRALLRLLRVGCSHEALLHVLAADEDILQQVLDGNDQGLQALLASLQDGSKTRVYRRLPWHQHPTNSNPGSRIAILGGIA